MNKYILFIIISLLATGKLMSDSLSIQWERYFDGNGNDDYSYGNVSDALGNVYLTGITKSSGQGNVFVTLKYSPSGELLWKKEFAESPLFDLTRNVIGIQKDGNENFYVVGYGAETIIILKYNSGGNLLWSQIYQHSEDLKCYPQAFKVDGAGSVFISGYIVYSDEQHFGWITLKYSPRGNLQYRTIYVNNINTLDVPFGIDIDSYGCAYVTGSSYNSQNGTMDYTTIKYSPLGSEMWKRYYNGSANSADNAYSIVVSQQGEVYITGLLNNLNSESDIVTLKYNSNGDLLWSKSFDYHNNIDIGQLILLDNTGNPYVSGFINGVPGNPSDWIIIKYDKNGTEIWSRSYAGSYNGEDLIKSFTFDIKDNIYLLWKSLNVNNDDVYLSKYDSSGSLLFTTRYGGSYLDYPTTISVDNSQDIIISGFTNSFNVNFDMFVVKYSQGLNENFENISGLSTNIYPNPFNPAANISFTLPQSSFVTIKIYDIIGREVAVLLDEYKEKGIHKVNFSAQNFNLSSGVYFCVINAGNHLERKPIVLVK